MAVNSQSEAKKQDKPEQFSKEVNTLTLGDPRYLCLLKNQILDFASIVGPSATQARVGFGKGK